MLRDPDLLLDVTRLVWRVWTGRLPTGIDRVCLAYLDHYGPRAVAVVQRGPWRLILSKPYSDRLFALLRRPERGFRRRLVALLTAAALSGGLRLPTRGWIYLNVGHTGLDAPGLAAWLARRGWCAVFLVHDLIPLSHPQYCRPGESDKHRARMQTVLSSAAGVIVNSQATAAALADFAHQAGVHAPPVQVAWLASESPITANRVPDQDRPVFVAIGTIEGRKNHLLLLRLWQRLAQALGPATPQLVLIGQRGWQADAVFALLDHCPVLKDHVHELGCCDDATMLGWLDRARAVLMPSLIEGFGLPVVEALQRGVPVIASDQAVFREIAGEIPLYLDPADDPAWETAVREYCGDCADRSRQLAAMGSYRAPTWEDHFAAIDQWLARLRTDQVA